jgi:hypothetical protein
MADEKPNEKPDEMTDAARLRDWMDSVSGNVEVDPIRGTTDRWN